MNDTEKYWNARPAAVRRKQAKEQKKLEEQAEVYRLFDQEHLSIRTIAARTHHRRTTISAWLKERASCEEQPEPPMEEAAADKNPDDPRDMEFLFSLNTRCYYRIVEKTIRIELDHPWVLEAKSMKNCTEEQQAIMKYYLYLKEEIRDVEQFFRRIEERFGVLTRRIVWLHYVECLTYRKTAERIGITERQVRHRCDKFRYSCFDNREIDFFAKEEADSGSCPDFPIQLS